MKFSKKLVTRIGGIAIGLVVVAVIGAVLVSHASATAKTPGATPAGSPSTADNVAIHYVDTHYAGKGQVRVLQTEADVERGVPAYDVRILAPDGSVYVVHIQRSTNAVLWANRAENQNAKTAHTSKSTSVPSTVPSGGPSLADNTAIHYVNAHYTGKGQARVLQTESDIEHGVPVYDIRILAPNGTMYVVHVQRGNNAVLSTNRAESQSTGTSNN